MKHNAIQAIKRTAPLIVIALTAYFFAMALSRNWHNLEGVSLTPDVYSILGIIMLVLSVVSSGILWGTVLERLSGRVVAARDAVRIHCASWLLKYVPGQAGSILNKLAWGKKHGFSKKTIVNSFIYENVLMVLAGFILSIPIVFIFRERLGSNLSVLVPLLVIFPMLLVAYKPVFYWILNTIFKLLKRKLFSETDFLSTADLLKFLSGYLIPRLLTGAGFVLIAVSFTTIEPSMYVGLGATYILAGIIGILAVFVPSGLGVREAVIVLFASQYFGTEQAIVLALLARFYATIADVGVFGIYFALNKGKLKQL